MSDPVQEIARQLHITTLGDGLMAKIRLTIDLLQDAANERDQLRTELERQRGGVVLPELRQVVTDALMGMIAAVTSTTPPADEPPPPFIQSAIDRAVDRIEAALAPAAAVVMPERWESKLARLHPTIEAGKWPAAWKKDAIEQELHEFRLNPSGECVVVPRELLGSALHPEDSIGRTLAIRELRALLAQQGKAVGDE